MIRYSTRARALSELRLTIEAIELDEWNDGKLSAEELRMVLAARDELGDLCKKVTGESS